MRQTFALFIIGMIALSTVAANSDVSYLKSLQTKAFGRSLIESIQIELKSSTGADAVDRILNLLRQIDSELVADQQRDTQQHTQYVATTRAQIKSLAAKVVQLTASIKQDKGLIASNNELIAAAQKQIVQAQKSLKAQNENLVKNLATQKETTRVYNLEFAKLSTYVAGIAQANRIIQHMIDTNNEGSFVEVANHLSNLDFQHPKYQGFMNVLAELLSSTDRVHGEGHVNAVVRLLNQLHDQLVKEITRLTQVYKRRMADLIVQQTQIESAIAILESTIAKLQQRVATLQLENTLAEQRILLDTQRREEAVQQGKDLTQELADHVASYNQRTADRKEERGIIAKVVNIFQTRLTDEVRSSVENLSN